MNALGLCCLHCVGSYGQDNSECLGSRDCATTRSTVLYPRKSDLRLPQMPMLATLATAYMSRHGQSRTLRHLLPSLAVSFVTNVSRKQRGTGLDLERGLRYHCGGVQRAIEHPAPCMIRDKCQWPTLHSVRADNMTTRDHDTLHRRHNDPTT
ncbi:hypothetical protein BC835DRAFT_1032250 [Cytidiella melzeri]|nr:hypothetical protein BC835DRAFT_1032250 [Cytidiella melzeri]